MDPVTLKLMQLILTSIFGAVAVVFGFILFLRGASGKSSIIVQHKDLKGKVTNASPGVFLTIAGILILYWSINRTVEKSEKVKQEDQVGGTPYDQWLANAAKVTASTDYGTLLNTVFPAGGFQENTLVLLRDEALDEVADSVYHDRKYWRILAALNKDRGYYSYDLVTAGTRIRAGSLLEYMTPARFEHTIQRETLLKVRGQDIKKVYDRLLQYADTAKDTWDMTSLTRVEKSIKRDFELSIAYQDYSLEEDYTLGELSLKYYQDRKYYRLIGLFNQKVLGRTYSPILLVAKGKELLIPYVTP